MVVEKEQEEGCKQTREEMEKEKEMLKRVRQVGSQPTIHGHLTTGERNKDKGTWMNNLMGTMNTPDTPLPPLAGRTMPTSYVAHAQSLCAERENDLAHWP
jgi:hypothetical protein